MDSQRRLGHILLAGLTGLTIGLCIGWWVWPVEWNDAPSAAAPIPQTLDKEPQEPAQTSEPPPVADEDTASTYARYFDWANRGLLILAATLLLAGGVVIGYQLLRQSKKSPAVDQPMLNFPPRAQMRSEPSAADPQIWRSSAVLKQAQRPPSTGLDENDIKGEALPYDDTDIVEPVFPAQPAIDDDEASDWVEVGDDDLLQEYPVDDQEEVRDEDALADGWQTEPIVAGLPNDPGDEEDEASESNGHDDRGKEQPPGQTSLDVVGAFEANYAIGIQSYDESFTINSADNDLLGACGMGVNESLDRAAANTDQVRLLDIWLYDRAETRSISQPLVSPGFDTTAWDERTDNAGSVTGAPLEVSPGLTCTLRSKQIALECTVKEVTFLDTEPEPRPLQSLKAKLVVRSRQ